MLVFVTAVGQGQCQPTEREGAGRQDVMLRVPTDILLEYYKSLKIEAPTPPETS